MSNPLPGKQYTVQSGDTLSVIAARAYGDAQLWPRIWKANQTRLKSDNPETISPGEIIIIPLIAEREALKTELAGSKLSGKEKDALTIIVDGLEIPVLSGRVIRTMDTAADGWTASIAWTPGEDSALDKVLLPYAYPPASVYIGNELIINGILYTVEPQQTESGIIKNLEGWSFTADVIDSTLKPPYEKNNVTLEQRANELVKPIGIKVIFETDPGGKFDRVTASPQDTIFGHLAKLALQRGILISSTPEGNLLFTKASSGPSVGTLEESQPLPVEWRARFDGRNRFNAYKAIGQSPGGNAKTATAIDNKVPRSRFQTFQANDTITGDIQKAADWRRSKQLADALTIPFPVSGWLAPNGSLWRENTSITVISKTIHVPQGFTFLIRSVEFLLEPGGKTATLNLIPPQIYTGEAIEDPWQ